MKLATTFLAIALFSVTAKAQDTCGPECQPPSLFSTKPVRTTVQAMIETRPLMTAAQVVVQAQPLRTTIRFLTPEKRPVRTAARRFGSRARNVLSRFRICR